MTTKIDPAIRELLSGPVAMHPRWLERATEAVAAHVGGEAVDLRAAFAPEARLRDRAQPTAQGVGVIEVFGTIFHRASYWGTTTERVGLEFDRMVDDEAIETIIFDINSPGGTVYGASELQRKILAARKKKRIIAVSNALMASAAYWPFSAAHEVVVTPSGEAGSIGVFGVHLDFSRMLEAEGITATIIRAGDHKGEGSPFEPLSPDALAHMQAQIDVYYDAFVKAVAKNRGVSVAKVARDFGQGRTLLAEEAVAAGMADRVGTLEEVLAEVGVDRRRQISMTMTARVDALHMLGAYGEAELVAARAAGVAPTHATLPALDAAPGELIGATEHPLQTRTSGAYVFAAGHSADDEEPVVEPDDEDEEHPDDEDDPDRDGSAAVSEPPVITTAPSAEQEDAMPDKGTAAQNGAATTTATPTVQAGVDRETEATRSAQIAELCAMHGIADRAADYIRSGRPVADIGLEIAREARQNLQAMTAPVVDLTEREAKRYSITRAIMSQVPRSEGGGADAGFELEISQEIEAKLPANYQREGGIMVPTRVRAREAASMGLNAQITPDLIARLAAVDPVAAQRLAALNTGTPTAGGNAVFTEGGELIDMLRSRMRVVQLGAQTLGGLAAPLAFPRQTGASQWSWRAENPGSDVADSDAAIGQVLLSPKFGTASTGYTRQFLTLGSIDADAFVQNDLNQIAARGIDKASIAGGGGDEPTGILSTPGVTVVPVGTNGGVPTYALMVQLETEVATDDADIGTLAYLTTPQIRGRLKVTEMFTGTNGMPVWNGREVNGYTAEVSTQVPSDLDKGTSVGVCHAILFGVWSQLLIGYFGAYELIVDPYSKKKQGLIEVTASQMAGAAVRNPESFATIQDATLS